MAIQIGQVEALFRYPVKSMAGESVEVADLGWHGLDGDRRLALRRLDARGGFPWLTASRLPEMILFVPQRLDGSAGNLPSHVCTPEGEELAIFGRELAADITRRHGSQVEMMYLDRGIFDEAAISVITPATIGEISSLAAERPDVRRFRPNILIRTRRSAPFEEDEWLGGSLSFGDSDEAATIAITNTDERCAMVSFDPATARATPEVLKTIVRIRNNKAGVYAAVTRRGRLEVGQPVYFERAAANWVGAGTAGNVKLE